MNLIEWRCLLACLAVSLQLAGAGCSDVRGRSNAEPADTTETRVAPDAETAFVLSAFFGLDDALPLLGSWLVCDGKRGDDGMPVVFSQEIDLATLQAGDFLVTRADGSSGTLTCATPAPAIDPGELRTILLVGDFGSSANPPISVVITGNVLSRDGSMNFRGARVAVTPLEDGPSMVHAEVVPEAEWALGQQATRFPFGGGNGCPLRTRQVVRVTWNGGITKPGGDEIDDVEGQAYRVHFESGVQTAPLAVADLGDGDNNHELCLESDAPVSGVSFPAGLLTDPREDANPATTVALSASGR